MGFAIDAKRIAPLWRFLPGIDETAWVPAIGMDGAAAPARRDPMINTVWMWAALPATAMSVWLQEITGIDRGNGRGPPPSVGSAVS